MTTSRKHPRNGINPQAAREAAANAMLTPSQSAANAIHSMTKDVAIGESGATGVDFPALVNNLEAANSAVAGGDLGCVESMLLDQAYALQAVFVLYMSKMANADYIEQVDALSKIALRSQNQCRQTLATLVELKNPRRATFIKQNYAVNQQINQGRDQTEIKKNSDNSSNELEELANEQLDTRKAKTPCSVNQEMEAVVSVHRAENG